MFKNQIPLNNREKSLYLFGLYGLFIFCMTILLLRAKSEDSIFVLITLWIVLSCALLYWRWFPVYFNWRYLNLPSFFLLSYVILIAIPSIFVFFNQDNMSKYNYFLASQSVLIAVPIGVLMASSILKAKPYEIERYAKEKIKTSNEEMNLLSVVKVSAIICSALIIFYIMYVPTVPLFALMSSNADSIDFVLLREESFKLLPPHLYMIFEFLRSFFLPFLCMVILGLYIIQKRIFLFGFFILFTLVSIFYASLSLAKAPPLVIIVSIIFYIYLARGCNIPLYLLLILSVVAFAIPVYIAARVAVDAQVNYNYIITVFKDLVFRRLFYLPSEVLYYYFDAFPKNMEFLSGASIRWFDWIVGGKDVMLPNIIYNYMFPESTIESGWANAAFIGAAWADFGWYGVIFYSIIVGFVLQALQIYICKHDKTILNTALHVFLLLFSAVITMNSITGTFFIASISLSIIVVNMFRGTCRMFTLVSGRLRVFQ